MSRANIKQRHAIRPRHKASVVVDSAKVQFKTIKKGDYNQFAKSLAKIFGIAPKPYKEMLKSFVLIGLHDGGKSANAEQIIAIHHEWLPSSVKASSKNDPLAICDYLQEITQIACRS